MGATLTTINSALKEVWTQDALEEQIYQDNPFLDELEKTSRYTIGEYAVTPIHTQRNGGYSAISSGGGNLNTAGNQGVAQAQWQFTHHNQQINIQGSAIDQSSSSANAVANVVDLEVSGALNDLKKQITRQAFSNGDGRITACGTTSASNVVVLDTGDGYDALVRRWLHVGSQVDIGTAASPTSLINGESVTAVSKVAATPTITVSTSITTTSSNFVSIKGNRTGTSATYEMNGLRNIVSTSADLGGLTVAANPEWQASEVTTTSQALTLSLMLAKQEAVQQNTGDTPTDVLTSIKQRRVFYSLLQNQARFQADNFEAGSVDKVRWNGLTIQAHPDCFSGDMYFLTKKNLFIVATDKPYWQNKITGGDILSWIQGTDSYGAKLTYRIQLATNRRNAHARLGGLT